jgi:hypothetical protein
VARKPAGTYSPDIIAWAVEMVRNGASLRDAEAALLRDREVVASHATVSRWCRLAGVKPNRRLLDLGSISDPNRRHTIAYARAYSRGEPLPSRPPEIRRPRGPVPRKPLTMCWCGEPARYGRATCKNEHARADASRGAHLTPGELARKARYRRVALAKGVRAEATERLTRAQGGACAICGAVTKLVLDHCHETLQPRSMLCSNCNTALGLLREDPKVAQALVEYCELCQEHKRDDTV